MFRRAPKDLAAMPGSHPHRQVAEPEDIASVVAFLLSDDAVNVVGEIIIASGGRTTA